MGQGYKSDFVRREGKTGCGSHQLQAAHGTGRKLPYIGLSGVAEHASRARALKGLSGSLGSKPTSVAILPS